MDVFIEGYWCTISLNEQNSNLIITVLGFCVSTINDQMYVQLCWQIPNKYPSNFFSLTTLRLWTIFFLFNPFATVKSVQLKNKHDAKATIDICWTGVYNIWKHVRNNEKTKTQAFATGLYWIKAIMKEYWEIGTC